MIGSRSTGLSLVLKFGLNRFIVSEILQFFYILPFWLEIAYSRPFLAVLGAYFSQIWSSIVLTPKRTILARKYVI